MRYEVEVKLGADFLRVEGHIIYAGLKQRPEGGRANIELINKLARHFKVPPSHIKIVSGFKSRRKIIEIVGIK
ncbi:MAG: DUF167 domain-containing protein [Candidatus Methanomethylicia archaeon]|jgi:uncharacterized protein YggU (UPF0235/DUF167 family)|uniref:DUF167 domain-containing protein n=1 Tax=Thermoproteota archaeon TaxID=2056631 RepID=A0A523BCA0_9CREN|nr:DUF167 domain-containing protein [Candidatus Methanomethylicia archaeon]MCQ5374691.1 DUF167 domain-containing protein [Candidatus Methanomethylicia archaeon]NHV61060.1 DUF167 domain-containing protein [Candidatus Verstraetearchaeota archaeon]TDA38535.1 MAG: DUF167 domain-containing protein [Candidatus Verstraetearchaeota archaeon]